MAGKIKLFIERKGVYVMMLIGLCRPVIIVMLLLPFVDSLLFRTTSHSYSESHANQFYEIHEGFRFVGHVIETTNTGEVNGGLRCARNRKCQSYTCHSDGHHGNETCELSDQTRHTKPKDLIPTKGFTYHEKIKQGWHYHQPGHSCKSIMDSGHSRGDREYWIDPESDGHPLLVYCDMTTDGGGWLLVANFMIDDSGPPSDWTAEQTYRGISNYTNGKMGISRNAMNELRTHLRFTQLRFHCSKQQGRTFHITTVTNSTGEAVVQYFSGQTDIKPSSCGSFVRVKDDNSQSATQCARWGYDELTEQFWVGKWGGVNNFGHSGMYDHAIFIAGSSHWIIGSGGRWECDDYYVHDPTISPNDFWRIFVR